MTFKRCRFGYFRNFITTSSDTIGLIPWDDSKQKLKLKAVKKSRIYNREIKVNVVKCFPTKP